MNKVVSFLRKKDLYYCVARYYLGGQMIGYGLLKIQGMQCKIITPFSAWGQTLEHLSGSQLTWAFLGYSYWFQILLGFFEFIPGCLLLFRRTALTGAVLALPMTVSVCLINYALDLWPYTKILSVGLVLLNVLIFVFERERMRTMIAILMDRAKKIRYFVPELIFNIVAVTGLAFYIYFHSFYDRHEKNVLTGDWFNRHHNEFTLVAEKIGDSAVPHRMVRAYFGPHGVYSELNDSVNNGKGFVFYSLDEKTHVLSFHPVRYKVNEGNYYYLRGDFAYEVVGDSLLRLRQQGSDSGHVWVLRKRVMNMGQ